MQKNECRYEERVSNDAGSYIVADNRKFEELLDKKPLVLEGLTVQVGEETTLYDWFFKPTVYMGMLDNRAIFYLGSGESDLFSSGGEYYDVTYVFDNNRIGKCYKLGTFRDFILLKGKWK